MAQTKPVLETVKKFAQPYVVSLSVFLLLTWAEQTSIVIFGNPPILSAGYLLAPIFVTAFSIPNFILTIIEAFRGELRFSFSINAVFFVILLAYFAAGILDSYRPQSETPLDFVLIALVSVLATAVPILLVQFKHRNA